MLRRRLGLGPREADEVVAMVVVVVVVVMGEEGRREEGRET